MLDYRYRTFLTLTEEMNYTTTAKRLHITQPAVTQHIQSLQQELGVELIHYEKRKLSLTAKGKKLQKDLYLLQREIAKVQEQLTSTVEHNTLVFGASLTIGEYMMPGLIESYLNQYPAHDISMVTDNTQHLIELMEHGKIDFAFVEGEFNQSVFEFQKIVEEPFIAVCSEKSSLWKQEQSINDLFSTPLLVREEGSGSRLIFETAIKSKGIHLDSFSKVMMIGSIGATKKLVEKNLGISFIYQRAVEEELNKGILKKIPLSDFNVIHPFYLIYLKRIQVRGMETIKNFLKVAESN
ncbi:LysR family transcriptional regulator [Desemzia sp. C1]|uniref:LysR family transcriptional regulator n=1 Tax=Desemzia sp. C1 TaxID=2892016 RepID=UPI001E46C5BB|nr:LysR family transcriptional regulator [Desemzia sp. C1]MCI3028394.1 LysR family transcriptional regulator [Desemzia sp. C1]